MGRLEPRKGVSVLLDAFACLDRDADLWIAGDGPQRDKLRARDGLSVEWLGRISDDEKAARLRSATVACFPAIDGESFGIVLLEAMAAGAALVASDIDGYRDVARHDREAYWSLPATPAVSAALSDLLASADRRDRCCGPVTSGRLLHERGRWFLVTSSAIANGHAVCGRPGRMIGSLELLETPVVPAIIIGAIVLIVVLFTWLGYNSLVKNRNRVDGTWSQIDVQLKRRHDLIPNLVEAVKGYAAHERGTFEQVTAARANAINAQGPEQTAAAENQLSGALKSLFAVAEAYPDLKANQHFLQLQEELTATEDKVAYARQFYNDSVLTYNTKIQQFPTVILAGMFNFDKRDFFDAASETLLRSRCSSSPPRTSRPRVRTRATSAAPS